MHPWAALAVAPIFGFANAGVSLSGITANNLVDSAPLGVALGLVIGKQVGVYASAALAIRFGLAKLPQGSNWVQLYGVAALYGIGFTMSLLIGVLAFPNSPHLFDEVKVGVLIASTLSAIIGLSVL